MKNKKLKKFLKDNYIPLLFALISFAIDLFAVFVTSWKFYLLSPWLFISVIAVAAVALYFLPSNRARHICASVMLSVLFTADLIFILIYDMTGTTFEYSMFQLRKDAMAILESIPLNFPYAAFGGVLLSLFIVFGGAFASADGAARLSRRAKRVLAFSLLLVLAVHAGLAYTSVVNANSTSENAGNMLYESKKGGYSDKGVFGNFVDEMYKGTFQKVEVGDECEIGDFLYRRDTVVGDEVPHFGDAAGYNVVTILAESFEWFSFVSAPDVYPNGYRADEETLRELYPNLYALCDSSVVMTNFHSREKTDISENLSFMGNYPLDYFINKHYPDNNIAYSLPNIMRLLYGTDSVSFHNGTNSFYNRDGYLPGGAGFSAFVASNEMEKMGMTNYIPEGERNLDSEMVETCKDEMFPADRRFNTYITTITMHGQYGCRENLQKYYDILDSHKLLPLREETDEDAVNANVFRYYAAAAMELDRMVGAIMRCLEERGIADKTVIAIFGDHNVYYQSLSNYVKNIYPKEDPEANITELYRVPLIIKVGAQKEQIRVDKFTCTADILPTLLSLLGIRYYGNFYYGHSVFDKEESLLYSRAYDVFMTDKLYFNTLDSIVWSAPEADTAYLSEIERRANLLMEKISHVNRIFAADYFRGRNLKVYETKMNEINAPPAQ